MPGGRQPLDHPWLLLAIAGLYIVSIPWWAGSGRPDIVLGMPLWAVIALAATLGVSCLTAFAVLHRWDDDDLEDDVDPSSPDSR